MSLSGLLGALKEAKSSKEAAASYKLICEWLGKNSPSQEKKVVEFLALLTKHMSSASGLVSMSSMKACGFTLKHTPLLLTGKRKLFLQFLADSPFS